MQRLEARLDCELVRVESTQRAILTDLSKWKKDRETCWKHVGELKDQNRHLRQRNYELEVQNKHLQNHLVLLQEQLTLAQETQTAWQSVLKAAQDRNALLTATLADQKIPKVPHSGLPGDDIW